MGVGGAVSGRTVSEPKRNSNNQTRLDAVVAAVPRFIGSQRAARAQTQPESRVKHLHLRVTWTDSNVVTWRCHVRRKRTQHGNAACCVSCPQSQNDGFSPTGGVPSAARQKRILQSVVLSHLFAFNLPGMQSVPSVFDTLLSMVFLDSAFATRTRLGFVNRWACPALGHILRLLWPQCQTVPALVCTWLVCSVLEIRQTCPLSSVLFT